MTYDDKTNEINDKLKNKNRYGGVVVSPCSAIIRS